MGYYMIKQSSRNDYNLCEFVIDTPDDIENINTNCTPGSTCFVISTSDVYMLSTEGEWKLL